MAVVEQAGRLSISFVLAQTQNKQKVKANLAGVDRGGLGGGKVVEAHHSGVVLLDFDETEEPLLPSPPNALLAPLLQPTWKFWLGVTGRPDVKG